MKTFRLDDAPIIFFVCLLAQIVLSFFLVPFSGDIATFLGYFLPQLVYIGVLLLYLKFKKIPLLTVVPIKKKIHPLAIAFSILVTVGVFMQNLLLSVSFNWLMTSLGIKMEISMPAMDNALNIVLAILLMCLLPAIGEESIFRGAFVTGLNKERGAIFAIFISALIFALSHLNPAQLVHQFILGAMLAYIVIRTGNIIFPMIIHFLNNLFAIVLPLVIPSFNNLGIMNGQSALIMAAMMVAGIAILYPSLIMLIKYASHGQYSFKESSIIAFFKSKTQELRTINKPRQYSFWLIILISALTLTSIVSTIMLAFPNLLN